MQPWARQQIKWQETNRELSIRPAIAAAGIRRQQCFVDVSDYDIRCAVWRNAAKVDFSIKRPDVGKYNYWPPTNRNEFENQGYRIGLSSQQYTGGEDEWMTVPHSGWCKLPVLADGLPDRELWVDECWKANTDLWREDGLPLPHKWPVLRIRLLTLARVGKAAQSLPFKCPMCHTTRRSEENFFHGGWILRSEFGDGERQIHCWDCSQALREIRTAKSPKAKQYYRDRLVSYVAKHNRDATVQRPVKIKTSRPDERAILRAIYDLGLIKEGDTL